MIKLFVDNFNLIRLEEDLDFSSLVLFNKDKLDFKVIKNNEGYEIILERDLDLKYDIDYKYKEDLAIIYRSIVRNPRFEDLTFFKGFLGCEYSKTASFFRIWAPLAKSVKLIIFNDVKHLVLDMQINGFCYELKIEGDFEYYKYYYQIERNNAIVDCLDPYSYGSYKNAKYSIVLDKTKFNQEIIKPSYVMKSYNDAIIYELSVRDFSSDPKINFNNPRKLSALIQEGLNYNGAAVGFDYLKSLGITHVQLMPILDFASYDEDYYEENYNWGYDPIQYNVLEGSYISDDNNPYNRINEFREVVNHFHRNNIRVNLDLVFNHVFEPNDFSLNLILPYYFLRYHDNEELANGSFCGNELRSEAPMLKRYFKDMISRYLELFDIDGIRFDLMSLMDIYTLREISDICLKRKADFMIYGEGWDLPSALKKEFMASINNASKLPNIAFFNGYYRDVLKAGSYGNLDRGYFCDNITKENEFIKCLHSYYNHDLKIEPKQSINYLSCHDNLSLFDILNKFYDNEEEIKIKVSLLLSCLLLTNGIPFIHMGSEFLRTKKGNENSYNAGDDVNMIDWSLAYKHQDLINYLRKLIKFRKEHKELHIDNLLDLEKYVKTYKIGNLLVHEIKNIKIVINNHCFTTNNPFKDCKLLFSSVNVYNELTFSDIIEVYSINVFN